MPRLCGYIGEDERLRRCVKVDDVEGRKIHFEKDERESRTNVKLLRASEEVAAAPLSSKKF